MTVENLTSFHRLEREHIFYLFLSGYHTRTKQALLQRIARENPGLSWHHFGDILLALEKQQSLEYRGRFLGTEEEILLEEPIEIDGTKYMMGHTRQYVKGAVPYEEGLKNKTVKGIFTKALNEEVLLLEKE